MIRYCPACGHRVGCFTFNFLWCLLVSFFSFLFFRALNLSSPSIRLLLHRKNSISISFACAGRYFPSYNNTCVLSTFAADNKWLNNTRIRGEKKNIPHFDLQGFELPTYTLKSQPKIPSTTTVYFFLYYSDRMSKIMEGGRGDCTTAHAFCSTGPLPRYFPAKSNVLLGTGTYLSTAATNTKGAEGKRPRASKQ